MRIHCICVVRDEVDIFAHTLDAALTWADTIYALDNGSTDGTWELLQDYARRHTQIVVVGRTYDRFRNSLRSDVANQYLEQARKGDWWCRLDADELYVDNPREFLARVPRRQQVVYAIYANYFFTEVDVERYQQNPNAYLRNWTPQHLRFYTTNYSDPRFVRHVPGIEWVDSWPRGIWELAPARERILMRNYDYRSPPQIERRVRIRTQHTEERSFLHEKLEVWAPIGLGTEHLVFPPTEHRHHQLWQTRVVRSSALIEDNGQGPLQINWDLVNPIWKPLPRHKKFARKARALARKLVSPTVGTQPL
jgi:glycosyltransferase involved in cell wall biosynthesis